MQILRAADVVDMGMAHDGIFDIRWIEAEFFQATDDLVLDRISPDRVDHDDALRSGERPGGIFLLADVEEIVEHLDGFVVPGRTLRYSARTRRCRRRAGRRSAQAVEQGGMI